MSAIAPGATDVSATDVTVARSPATDGVLSQAMSPLWEDFGAVNVPLTLVRGSTSPVVDDEDVAEARRRQPEIDVRVIDGAGHSVQGDRPVELAAVLEELLG